MDDLYESPDTKTYEAEDREEMVHDLLEQDQHTVMFSLEEPRQILLTSDGVTQLGGLKFTSLAFMQLCRILSPGLANLVTDLAGTRRRTTEMSGRDWHNSEEALHILNILIQRRFTATLQGKQAIRDTRTGVLEGIVGRNYQRLPNCELFERTDDVLKSYRQPAQFYYAAVVGRRVMLVYRDEEAMLEAPARLPGGVDAYHGGFYYINSELGDGAVRASIALVRQFDGSLALGNYYQDGGRVSHKGNDFRRRFERLLSKVAEKSLDQERLTEGLKRLSSASLGFAGNDENDQDRFEELAQILQARKLTQGLAKRVLRSALLQASTDKHPYEELSQMPGTAWAERTAYDLFCAMGRVARNLPLLTKEGLEQMAYGLLVGRTRLTITRRNT